MSLKKNIIFGTSMYPFYKDGERVYVKDCTGNFLIGECYAFKYKKIVIFHRLYKKEHNTFLFIGDNSYVVHSVNKDSVINEPALKTPNIIRILVSLINIFFVTNSQTTFVRNYIRKRLIRILFLTITRWKNEKKI